jgi:phage baseplate assembly protein gpV
MRGEIRVGRISSTDAKRHTAQVQLFEVDGLITWDLQVLVTRPGDYSLPAPNTPVLCLMLDHAAGVGFVLGAIYTESDAAPTDDSARRVVAGDDVRLGAFDASDKVALAPAVKGNFDDLKTHFTAVEAVITGPPINEPGNGAPSAFQTALAAAIGASSYPTPADPAAEKVRAK